jgi:hypothetical protein
MLSAPRTQLPLCRGKTFLAAARNRKEITRWRTLYDRNAKPQACIVTMNDWKVNDPFDGATGIPITLPSLYKRLVLCKSTYYVVCKLMIPKIFMDDNYVSRIAGK